MKKVLIPLAVILGVIMLFLMWGVGVNNSLVSLEEGVNEKKSQVENVYQRRADLIPNLVNTVKGYAKHEAQVFREVTEARSKVGQVRIGSPEDAQGVAKFEQAQGQLSSALSRLLVVAERYPDLKADRGFRDLQSQLEGTENRITTERQRFNEAARDFNVYARKFPQVLIAGLRGFQQKAYFTAKTGAENAPQVEF